MDEEFKKCMKFCFRWEGSYVFNKLDPGGETNFGVTRSVYDNYRRQNRLPAKPVKEMTKEEAEEIYYKNYWLSGQCNKVPYPLNLVMLDTAINFGIQGMTNLLQPAALVKGDGILGKGTLEACNKDPEKIAKRLVAMRIGFRYNRIRQNPKQSVFLAGWLNRDRSLEDILYGKEI